MFQLRPHQQKALDALSEHRKGICVFPTGAGKTNIGIFDAMRVFESSTSKTVVVVAPRILLAEQLSSEYLEFITDAHVMHVHSGETNHFRTMSPNTISSWVDVLPGHKIIFTTYHSLRRLMESKIDVDTIYFDEAHNSVQRRFFPAVEYFSQESNRCYFFTATPKHSNVLGKPGMNDVDVYGRIIASASAVDLVNNGYIIPPKVSVKELPLSSEYGSVAERDCANLLDILEENPVNKLLICGKSSADINNLLSGSDFYNKVSILGYSVMHITSKYGAIIDGRKVDRDVFFSTLNSWGKDPDKKFIVLHFSILAEGINISSLEAVVFMRNMDVVGIGQTIGRTLRLHPKDAEGIRNGSITPGKLEEYTKSFGLVVVPVFSKATAAAANKIQSVVDIVFEKGDIAVSTITR